MSSEGEGLTKVRMCQPQLVSMLRGVGIVLGCVGLCWVVLCMMKFIRGLVLYCQGLHAPVLIGHHGGVEIRAGGGHGQRRVGVALVEYDDGL